MIITRIYGGLGNQIFQYALGRRIAMERDVLLKLDITWFYAQNKRKFELDQFNINAEIATRQDIEKFSRFSQNRLVRKTHNWIKKISPYRLGADFIEQFPGTFGECINN